MLAKFGKFWPILAILSRVHWAFWCTFYRPQYCGGVLKLTNMRYDWKTELYTHGRFKCQTLDSQGGTELQYCNCHGSGCNENWDTAGSSGGSSAGGIRPMKMIFLALVGILPIMSTLSHWIGESQIGFKVWYITLPLQCQLLLAFCAIHFFSFTIFLVFCFECSLK